MIFLRFPSRPLDELDLTLATLSPTIFQSDVQLEYNKSTKTSHKIGFIIACIFVLTFEHNSSYLFSKMQMDRASRNAEK